MYQIYVSHFIFQSYLYSQLLAAYDVYMLQLLHCTLSLLYCEAELYWDLTLIICWIVRRFVL